MPEKIRLKSRPGTAADVAAYYGRNTPYTVRCRVIEQDGEVIAVAGYYLVDGFAVVFSEMKADIPAITIWREARAMMDGMTLPAVCIAEEESGPFLERLGWTFMGHSESGDVYKWQHY